MDWKNYNKDVFGARVSLEWDASDKLMFRLSADYTEDDSDPKFGHRLLVGGASGAPVLNNVYDTRGGLNAPDQSVEASGVALVAEWQLNDAITLKNVIAYREDETWSPIDFDSLAVDDMDVPVVYENEQLSEEFQILYSGDKLSGVAGIYYLDANAFNEFDVILAQVGDLIGVPGLNANTLGDVDTDTWSVFADFSYDLTDSLSLSVGGRYTSDERSSQVLRRTFAGGLSPTFGGSGVAVATTSDFEGSEEFTEFSPRLSLAWQPSDAHNFYISYSEGFKGGSFDPRGQTSGAPDLNGDGNVDAGEVFAFMQFDPETVESYEIGWKASLLDNRLTTSLALFFADYEDVQIPGSVGIDTTGDGVEDTFTGITTNAGRAELPGVEFEGAFAASEQWNFAWAIGYLDAEYKEFINASGEDVADDAVFQNTPKWTTNLSVSYETPMTLLNRSGNFSVITSLTFRDEASQFEFPNELLDEGAYSLWDLSLVWEDDEGHWRAGVHGKNLTDEEYKVAGYNFPTLGQEGNVTAFYGNPRTVTGTLEYQF